MLAFIKINNSKNYICFIKSNKIGIVNFLYCNAYFNALYESKNYGRF